MFLLISVCDREIVTEKFETLSEAIKQLKEEFTEFYLDLDFTSKKEMLQEAFSDDCWIHPSYTEAWANIGHNAYDWLIVEV